MRWLVPSLALALAQFAGACASTPGYGQWVAGDYCAYSNADARHWRLSEPPPEAEAYRALTRGEDRSNAPDDAREFWFEGADGAVKLCLTNLERAGGRWDWCNPKRAVWWEFRRTEAGLAHDGANFRVCVT